MGFPAARIGDMHVCPMVTPAVVPIPHVGGPIMGPGCPTVLIGGMPAAVVGDTCICTGPPSSIVLGSTCVLIGGRPAARLTDMTAHGGSIVIGCPTVLIGDVGGSGGGGGAVSGSISKMKNTAQLGADKKNKEALQKAAKNSDGLAPKSTPADMKAQFTLVDEANKGISNFDYRIETKDGAVHNGTTDSSGKTTPLSGYMPGECRVSFIKN